MWCKFKNVKIFKMLCVYKKKIELQGKGVDTYWSESFDLSLWKNVTPMIAISIIVRYNERYA